MNKKPLVKTLLSLLLREWFFVLSLAGFLLSIAITGRFPHYEPGDWRVLFTLWVFLSLAKGLEECGLLKRLAAAVERGRWVELKLVITTYLLSMVVTNDVALLTVVPLSLHFKRVDVRRLVILETLAANAGSALTPIGNPQNIFIYHHYETGLMPFLKATLPFALPFLPLLLLLTPKDGKIPSECGNLPPVDWQKAAVLLSLFILFIPAALRLLPVYIGLLPLLYLLFFFRRALFKTDYFLLATFFLFFGFTDNISHAFRLSLSGNGEVFFGAALLSQILSNVPAALLLADFTANWQALLWGVNVGGFGTLVASLANLISYKLYRSEREDSWGFLLSFHLWSLLFFLVGVSFYTLFWILPFGKEVINTLSGWFKILSAAGELFF